MATLTKSQNFEISSGLSHEASSSILDKYLHWCEDAEPYRFGILATIVAIQGCIIIPLTLIFVLYFKTGLEDLTFIALSATTVAVMVTNMALTSMKIIITTFGVNLIINIALICLYVVAIIR